MWEYAALCFNCIVVITMCMINRVIVFMFIIIIIIIIIVSSSSSSSPARSTRVKICQPLLKLAYRSTYISENVSLARSTCGSTRRSASRSAA